MTTGERGFTLRVHQHAASEFIRSRRGTLLGDEPRVGKTLSVLASHDPTLGPLLVVCPLIAREVWLTWIARMFPGEDVGVMMGKTYNPVVANKPIVVCHYDILPHWQLVRRYGTVAFDEAHILSNPGSQRTKAAVLQASRAERVVAATGTPVWNRPIGLWSLLGLIAPGAFGNRYLFGERYCDPKPTAYGTKYEGASNEAELSLRLSTVRLRRFWRDVQEHLPQVTRDVAVATLTPVQSRAIDLAVAEIKSGTAASLARFRRALGAAKVNPTVEIARQTVERGEPIVVWAWHRDTAKAIAAKLPGSYLITGDTPPAKREDIFRAWKADIAPLVLTIATGQVGIDLSHAHIAIFAEIDWTPALIYQAEMRTYAPTRAMHVTYVTADHLVERQLVNALSSKLASSAPLGADVAAETIDILLTAFNDGAQTPDMERLARDLLSADFVE